MSALRLVKDPIPEPLGRRCANCGGDCGASDAVRDLLDKANQAVKAVDAPESYFCASCMVQILRAGGQQQRAIGVVYERMASALEHAGRPRSNVSDDPFPGENPLHDDAPLHSDDDIPSDIA